MKYRIDNWLLSQKFRQYGFCSESVSEHKGWKSDIKEKLFDIIGRIDEDTEIKVDMDKQIQFDGYTMIRADILTLTDVYMPMYILEPENGNGIPVIALHGHGCNGKNGLVGIEEGIKGNIEKYNYTYALDLVKKGYTVYVPDLCANGERKAENKTIFESSCTDVNFALMSMGLSLAGVIVYELKKLVDFIAFSTDKPIKCVGFSGGGLYALLLSALDERIETAVVSGYYHSFKDTALFNNFCGCNFAYKLWKYIDCCDLGMMIAPRRLAVEVGREDKLNGKRGIDGALEQIEMTKKVYEMYDSDNFKYFIGSGKHQWYGMAYDFL